MRAWLLVVAITCEGCTASAPADTAFVARRPIGGAWETVTTTTCETDVDAPSDTAWEVSAIRVREIERPFIEISSHRLGPASRTVHVACSPERADTTLTVQNVGEALVAVGDTQAYAQGAPDAQALARFPTGSHDVIAEASLPAPALLVAPPVDVAAAATVVDFATAVPLSRRTFLVTNAPDATVTAITKSGTTLLRFPVSRTEVWALPADRATGIDRELRVRQNDVSTYVDLATAGDAFTVTLPDPLPDVTPSISSTTFQVTTSAPFTPTSSWLSMRSESAAQDIRWDVVIDEGWTGPPMSSPDVTAIPDWRDAWNPTGANAEVRFGLCQRDGGTTNCFGSLPP